MNGRSTNDTERTEDREPDPARSYERAKPEKEAGMGRLDDVTSGATPTDRPDRLEQAVTNAQPPRQLNADEVIDARAAEQPAAPGRGEPPPPRDRRPDDPILKEEPLGEDLMPIDIHDPHAKRHLRKEGKGGTA